MNRLSTGIPIPQASRWKRALACGMGAVLLAAASPANNDGAVISLSVMPTGGKAQVVIGVDGGVSVRDFVLRNPDRIVVDITGAKLNVKRGGYDRIARGGVLDVRWAQNQTNVVRVVLTVDGPRDYEVVHNAGSVSISVDGGGSFASWRVGRPPFESPTLVKPAVQRTMRTNAPATASVTQVSAQQASLTATDGRPVVYVPSAQQRQQPRITIAWERADIRDVLAAFAAFSGRTILPARGVEGTITAEIIDKPWDVAMRAILNANGYDAVEDENGIIIVNTLEALARRPSLEPLVTRTVRLNYVPPGAIADALKSRLSRDCGATGGAAGGGQSAGATSLNCPSRGAVSADSLSNSISITDGGSVIEDLVAYARSLDIRQPQVNIKAKIILVDRTQLDGLGLKYDLGTPNHHFNELVPRVDSTGQAEEARGLFTAWRQHTRRDRERRPVGAERGARARVFRCPRRLRLHRLPRGTPGNHAARRAGRAERDDAELSSGGALRGNTGSRAHHRAGNRRKRGRTVPASHCDIPPDRYCVERHAVHHQ